jgi:hypothetical protein
MKAIKKVAVTPVQVYTGQIIDSFNTTSNKHTNAPSLNAVETYFKNTSPVLFNNVADMLESTILEKGVLCKTLGYYDINDGGGAEYYITDETPLSSDYYIEVNETLNAIMIIKNDTVNSKQFGCYIDNTHDDTSALQDFFDFLNANNKVGYLMEGVYKVTDEIEINCDYTQLVPIGNVKINDYGTQTNTLKIISTDTTSNKNSKNFISNEKGNLTIENINRTSSKVGCEISRSGEGTQRYDFNLNGLNVNYYDVGIKLNAYNVYLNTFNFVTYFNCEVGLYIGEGGISNSGENMLFYRNIFSRCNCCVRIDNSVEVKFENCSFDFNNLLFYIKATSLDLNLYKCWLEGMCNRLTDTIGYYDANKNGLIYADDNAQWFNKINVNIENCNIQVLNNYSLDGYLINGNTICLNLKNNKFWYGEGSFRDLTIGNKSFENLFLCNTLRKINSSGNNYKLASRPFVAQDLSLTDGYLSNETTGAETTFGYLTDSYFHDFDIVSSGTDATKFQIISENGKKCFKITPPYSGASSVLSLQTKTYYKVENASVIMGGMLKGYKSNQMTRVVFKIEFFDSTQESLGVQNVGSTWRTDETNIDPTEWIAQYRVQELENLLIPKNAIYCKPIFELYALNGSYSDTVIAGHTVKADDPVYFTGLFTFFE